MRLLGTAALIGTIYIVAHSPGIVGEVRDTLTAPPASTQTTAEDQKTYERLCPLLRVWSDLDADGRTATTRTIKRLAAEQQNATQDPALKAFLAVIPAALGTGSSLQSKTAAALIERECTAHEG